jgi:hypothetical protein
MQRLIWVKKRFWFALAMVGLILAGHWYAVSHPPHRTAQSPSMPTMPAVTSADEASGDEPIQNVETPAPKPDATDHSAQRPP